MGTNFAIRLLIIAVATMFWAAGSASAATFRVATYNLENYLDHPTTTRPHVKSPDARAKIRETIRTAHPDILALEEMGTTNALLELRASLQAEVQSYPCWEMVQGFDTNIHVAVLSKFPIVARRPHTNDFFLLDGRRFQVKRGFAEVDVQVETNFVVTLLVAHLKSALPTPEADEAEERLSEAKILRRIIDARLAHEPQARIIVTGDFNDIADAPPTKQIIGRGGRKFFDTRPTERSGAHDVAWTYHYSRNDTYSRIDFILLSPALKENWLPDDTEIPTVPGWRTGSDHRLIVAGFTTEAARPSTPAIAD